MRLVVVFALAALGCASIPPMPQRTPVNLAHQADGLVERGLQEACRRYAAGFDDRRTMLACGKWMFFYESFDTGGVPQALPFFLVRAFPKEIGHGFEKLGMIEDPASPDHMPFGLAPGKMLGMAKSQVFTCAGCHVARLPDGRISVGAPNHRYQYGKQILAMTMFPFVATSGAKGHDPDAVAFLQPMLDEMKKDPTLWAKLGGTLMLAMGAFKMPSLPPEVEHMYVSWPPGTQDFVLQPLPVDDKVHVVGKIPPLYDLPRDAEIASSHMAHAMYGWTGNAHTLLSFMHGFINLGGGDAEKWPAERLRPLLEYLYSLEAPKNPDPPPAATVAAGKALFHDKGCHDCHGGPRHSGKRVYKLDEIGTDPAVARWLDGEQKGTPCCGVKIEDPLTGGIKSPRLQALWLQRRFLHNGSLSSLEQLFCLEPRPKLPAPFGGEGHRQTCEGLGDDDKRALIGYLRSL